jgi:hypothetical protein
MAKYQLLLHVTALQPRVNPFCKRYVASTLESSVFNCHLSRKEHSWLVMLTHIICIVATSRDDTIKYHKQTSTNTPQAAVVQLELQGRTATNKICSYSLGKHSVECIMGKSWLSVRSVTDSIESDIKTKTFM